MALLGRLKKKKKKGLESKIIATILKTGKGSNNVGDNPDFLTVDTSMQHCVCNSLNSDNGRASVFLTHSCLK